MQGRIEKVSEPEPSPPPIKKKAVPRPVQDKPGQSTAPAPGQTDVKPKIKKDGQSAKRPLDPGSGAPATKKVRNTIYQGAAFQTFL